jgi:L-aspartate oxidase
VAGLTLGILLAEAGIPVTLVAKTPAETTQTESNSAYAQGGMAVCLPEQNPEGDSFIQHLADTLNASAGRATEAVVTTLLAQAPGLVAQLQRWGVPFDTTPTGALAFTKEAAHQVRRVIHAGGDATGKHLMAALFAYAQQLPLLTVQPQYQLMQLIQTEPHTPVLGGWFYNAASHSIVPIVAQHTILATGGLAGLYTHTTNPSFTSGEALGIAHRAGCTLKDLAFIQFHPTAFYWDGQARFLVSEALRGEGGILRNHTGEAFATRYHPQGELAPRDIVARMIYQEIQAYTATSGTNNHAVFLDMTHLPADFLLNRFPTIAHKAAQFGIDITQDWLPVAPAAHYTMGGITTQPNGATNLPNLWAIGECACTGLHGANRLASNSLLECGAMALLAFDTLQPLLSTPHRLATIPLGVVIPIPIAWQPLSPESQAHIEVLQPQLKQLLWQYAGVVRTQTGLLHAHRQVQQWLNLAEAKQWQMQAPLGVAFYHQLTVANQLLAQALALPNSLGAHYLSP